MKVYFPAVLVIFLIVSCSREERNTIKHISPVPFTAVHLNDIFWAPRIEVNRKVTIPVAFGKCEETGRLDNFALAGGLIHGVHKGDFPFDDTDVYKMVEGASYTLAVKYDPKLDHYLDSIISLIGAAQEEDGYLYTCLTNGCERLSRWYGRGRWDRLNSHELYNCGHLYEAAVAHYQATGKRSLLDIALKNADLVDRVFGPGEGKKKVPSGHPIIEMALVKLYRVTGNEKYLRLARFFIDETGKGTDGHPLSPYSQDHKPITAQDEAVGHAVRFGYLYSGVTDVAALMNDENLLAASRRVWENVVSRKLYITGGIGSRAQGEGFGPGYELPNMTAYCETCAAIANVYWNYRLFLSSGDARYIDILERTLYNAVLSGVSQSGDRFFYDNPLESARNHDRSPWFGCACCPGNITRFLPSVPGYQYAAEKTTVYINLFASGDALIPLGHDTLNIRQQTKYPWDGRIVLTFGKIPDMPVNLKVRIPGWVRNQPVPSGLYQFTDTLVEGWRIWINGKITPSKAEKGFVTLNRRWKNGDHVEIDLPMPVRRIAAMPEVTNNNGKLAFQRGPLVYCLEDKDNAGGRMFDLIIPRNSSVTAAFEPSLLNGLVTLSTTGYKPDQSVNKEQQDLVPVKAIPYYAWNNRGTANMLVWIPEAEYAASPAPEPTPASSAVAVSSTDWAPGLNDGFDPGNSADVDKSYFYWWLRKGTSETVEYQFSKPCTFSETSVYWLNLDHYDGNYRVPEKWQLLYRDVHNHWVPVESADTFGIRTNCYNTVHFRKVKTTALQIRAQLQKNSSAGILEWKIR